MRNQLPATARRLAPVAPARFRAPLAAIVLLGVIGLAADADARPRPRAQKFSANKTFGLGFMIGAPTGLSGKYYLDSSTAVDFGVGAFPGGRNRDGLHLHFDVLWHPAVLGTADPFIVPIYFGVGGRVFDFDGDGDDDLDDDDFGAGVRFPGGIMLDFNNVPIDVFFELVVTVDFIFEGRVDVDFGGALGFRYYFN